MRRSSTQQSIKQLGSLPTASGGLSRLAANRLRRADIRLEPLLSRVGLTIEQIDDPEQRIDARRQIAFLETAAKALNDVFLGLSLAEEFDCRDLGLLYYVMASSDTLGDALKRASRYSRITNEAIVLQYLKEREPTLRLTYSGIPRHADRQQIDSASLQWSACLACSAVGSFCPGTYPYRTSDRKVSQSLLIFLVRTLNLVAAPMRLLSRPAVANGR
jgi:hypothetical protein